MRMIPYGRQSISQEDIDAVTSVLRSDWLTQGPAIEAFEQGMAQYCGAAYALATSNATAALHIACLALGVGEGDLVWTSPNSFVASANCALYCSADVDFVDIDPITYNMSVPALRHKLELASSCGRLPKVVIPVHFAGQSCDMKSIAALAQEFGFSVIEDASHAVGAEYLGNKVGSCRYSDVTVFSFHPVKILTTGEGGMLLCNREELSKSAARFRSHGVTRDVSAMESESDGPWYYEQIELGHNYRITDIQAALGLSQLQRLDTFVARRREIATRYDRLLRGLPVLCPGQQVDSKSAYHLYPIGVSPDKNRQGRRAIFEAMRARGIGVNVHYIPIHLQPYYRKRGFKPGDFPVAEAYYAQAISLPLYYALTDADQDQVVAALTNALI